MDRDTVERYDSLTTEWIESSHPEAVEVAAALGAAVDGVCADLGCGPGWHLEHLGAAPVGLDASGPMAAEARARTHRPIVQADLDVLDLADQAVEDDLGPDPEAGVGTLL